MWFQGTNKLKSAYLSRFHQVIRSLCLIIEAYTKRQEKQKANHADPVTILVLFYRDPRQISYHSKSNIKTPKPGRSLTNLYAVFIQRVRSNPCFENTNKPISWKLNLQVPGNAGGVGALWRPKGYPRQSFGYDIAISPPYTRRIPLFARPFLVEKPQSGVEIRMAVTLPMISSLLSILLGQLKQVRSQGESIRPPHNWERLREARRRCR